MDIFDIILNFIFRFILGPIFWILSLIWKFLKNVMNHLYGKIVALVATGILIYLISRFVNW